MLWSVSWYLTFVEGFFGGLVPDLAGILVVDLLDEAVRPVLHSDLYSIHGGSKCFAFLTFGELGADGFLATVSHADGTVVR